MLKFLRLSWRDKGRALEALCLVVAARFVLVALPFRTTVALTASLDERWPASEAGNGPQIERLSFLVQRVSHLVPGATCLTQALALKWMLTRRRIVSRVRIGVAHDPDGPFKAHAWLETASERVILGGARSSEHYTPLPFALEKRR